MSAIQRETVAYDGPYGAGTIVVSTAERRLYYVLGGGQALRYGVGVGRPGFTWGGVQTITMKREWPDWRPPAEMIRRRPDLPRYMKGGVENPLGARAMYLGGTMYRIHGSNEPETIGTAVSSGCIRMTNEDVMDSLHPRQGGHEGHRPALIRTRGTKSGAGGDAGPFVWARQRRPLDHRRALRRGLAIR